MRSFSNMRDWQLNYYYLCGLMGHVDDSCAKLLMIEEDTEIRQWGPELRADLRNTMVSLLVHVTFVTTSMEVQSFNHHRNKRLMTRDPMPLLVTMKETTNVLNYW